MFAPLFPILLWLSQIMLSAQCGCPVEPLTEVRPEGTWVGATSPVESAGALGWYFAADGSITFENHGS